MAKNGIYREHITYVREDVDTNKQMYHGSLVRLPKEKLNRAYELLTTITGQHLRIEITGGVSHRFHYPGNVDAYVYGPEGDGVRHIKVYYDAVLPLLQMLEATGLPLRISSK